MIALSPPVPSFSLFPSLCLSLPLSYFISFSLSLSLFLSLSSSRPSLSRRSYSIDKSPCSSNAASPLSQRKDFNRSESLRVVSNSRMHRIFRPSDLIHGEVLGKGCFGQAIKVNTPTSTHSGFDLLTDDLGMTWPLSVQLVLSVKDDHGKATHFGGQFQHLKNPTSHY